MEEDDAIGVFAHRDADVAEVGEAVGEQCELVIMRGKERAAADTIVQMFNRRPGE